MSIDPAQAIKDRMTELRPAVEEYHQLLQADEALNTTLGPLDTTKATPPQQQKNKRKKDKTGGARYTPDTKAQAVARYSETGSMTAVAREFGVAFSTIKGWVKQARKAAQPETPEEGFPREVTTDV